MNRSALASPNLAETPRLARAGDLELAARRALQGLYAGRHRSPFLGSSPEFADHRAYMPGDDLRHVDWKAYARSDHLLIRRYHEERDLPLVLCCDTSASMDYGEPSKLEWMRLAAAILGLIAVDQGDRVRLCSGAETLSDIQPDRGGPPAASAICRQLCDLQATGRTDGAAVLDQLGTALERRAFVVFCTDLLEDPDAIASAAAALHARGHEVVILQVLDPSERHLPADWEHMELIDPEGMVEQLGCDARDLKDHYDRAMADHLDRCRRLLAAARVEHLFSLTDADPAQVLGAWIRHRRRR